MCPFCNQVATITDSNTSYGSHTFDEANKDGDLGIKTEVVVCPNPPCREYMIVASLHKHKFNGSSWTLLKDPIEIWQLRPKSLSKPFPRIHPQTDFG